MDSNTTFSDASAQFSDDNWVSVLAAVDQTYAELVHYQQALEDRNMELENLRRFLGSVMSSISDVLVVCNPKGQIVDVSRSFEAMVRYGKDEIIAHDLFQYIDPQDHDRIRKAIETVMLKQGPPTLEANLAIDNETIPLEFNFAARLDDRGRPIGVTMVGRPLGELRRAYRQMEDSHQELKQAQAQLLHSEKLASLGRLLAGVAHELNNPISFVYANTHSLDRYLGKIETYFGRVQDGASREELVSLRSELKLDREIDNMRQAIVGSREGSERVRDIVEDLRRLSADGSGESAEFDLVDASRTAAEWVLRGKGEKNYLHVKGEEKLVSYGRMGHIQQIVMNLVQNALDAVENTQNPSIELEFAKAGEQSILRVIDNGTGIKDEIASNIFDPFFTTKPVGKGTGLGLSISYKIAEENGGKLSLVPSPDGCIFELQLKGTRP